MEQPRVPGCGRPPGIRRWRVSENRDYKKQRVLHPSFRSAASPWPLVYSSPDATILDNEREIRFVIPKNRGPDQCAPVIRAAIMVRER